MKYIKIILAALLIPLAVMAQQKGEDYQVFGRKMIFEPSGIARTPEKNTFLVVNDKDDEPPVVIFRLEGGKMTEAGVIDLKKAGIKTKKFEGITASKKSPGIFYAITSFTKEKGKNKKLIRIELNKDLSLKDAREMGLYDPELLVKQKFSRDWLAIEAITLTPDERSLLIGIRSMGESSKKKDFGVTILQYDIAQMSKEPKIIVNIDISSIVGRPEGISDMSFVPELGKYLVLTSYENMSDGAAGENAASVGGHLWFAPEDLAALNKPETWKKLESITLKYKSEGAEYAGDNKVIIVFDEDQSRKSMTDPSKIKLQINQDYFLITNVPPSAAKSKK